MTAQPVLDDLLVLPPAERLALAEKLWASLASEPDRVPVPDWHRDLIDERLAEDGADSAAGEAFATLRRRLVLRPNI